MNLFLHRFYSLVQERIKDSFAFFKKKTSISQFLKLEVKLMEVFFFLSKMIILLKYFRFFSLTENVYLQKEIENLKILLLKNNYYYHQLMISSSLIFRIILKKLKLLEIFFQSLFLPCCFLFFNFDIIKEPHEMLRNFSHF